MLTIASPAPEGDALDCPNQVDRATWATDDQSSAAVFGVTVHK